MCGRGSMFLGVCCLFQIGSALSSASMAPLVIVCSSRRGEPTVFKSFLHVLDATLDQPGTAMQTRHRPGARGVHGVDLEWNRVWMVLCVLDLKTVGAPLLLLHKITRGGMLTLDSPAPI